MKLIKQTLADARPDTSPIFIGDVVKQNLVSDGDAASQRITAVTFRNGARNKWHRHATEQVLVTTDGHGIVADDQQELRVSRGDIVLIQPGERHWHGAQPGQDFTHLSILLPGETTIDE